MIDPVNCADLMVDCVFFISFFMGEWTEGLSCYCFSILNVYYTLFIRYGWHVLNFFVNRSFIIKTVFSDPTKFAKNSIAGYLECISFAINFWIIKKTLEIHSERHWIFQNQSELFYWKTWVNRIVWKVSKLYASC